MAVRDAVFRVVVCAMLLLGSCAGPDVNRKVYPFVGDWQGSGVDSEGNAYTFAARVMALGAGRYRVLILDALDTQKEPLHVMEGTLSGNQFPYTADEGMYVGGGTLGDGVFEGYYKGPVDGTYKMKRVR